ncbi:UNKNOWN [Stylonychia lemnae]|uniref:Uncharacterized protein n=1 Tax=Stylonychia lemnae TaxID=5949 RepID=A0A078A367_STYLE|nr:UNKNOWN [Stylonychia lemnae]|eukprot:CDW75209.1 UNKNOWN [Stylonychia lemnae]
MLTDQHQFTPISQFIRDIDSYTYQVNSEKLKTYNIPMSDDMTDNKSDCDTSSSLEELMQQKEFQEKQSLSPIFSQKNWDCCLLTPDKKQRTVSFNSSIKENSPLIQPSIKSTMEQKYKISSFLESMNIKTTPKKLPNISEDTFNPRTISAKLINGGQFLTASNNSRLLQDIYHNQGIKEELSAGSKQSPKDSHQSKEESYSDSSIRAPDGDWKWEIIHYSRKNPTSLHQKNPQQTFQYQNQQQSQQMSPYSHSSEYDSCE